MTIFDKISGFAQKAKENALSRAILAKDKRLDKSMSESIEAANIGLLKMATYGVSGTVTAVAFDPIAGLLAVGGGCEQDTYIRLFGKGVSAELVLDNPMRVKYLQFNTGHALLVAVDMKNVITIYDLKTKRARHVVTTPSIVTALEYCTGTDWMFVGFADGNVNVLDINRGRFSEEYGIPDLVLEDAARGNQQDAAAATTTTKTSSLVVAIQMHPTDLNLILIGYESAAYLWNIREQAIKKRFAIQRHTSLLTCLAWSPCGHRFMAGYDDGYMRLWDMRTDQKPVLSRRAFHASPSTSPSSDPCEPIYRMLWYVDDASKKSFLVVAGGSDLPDIRGLHIMEFDTAENDPRDARRQTILSTSVDVSDFILLSQDPYFLGMHNPLGLLVVGCDGAIRAYGLDHGYPQLTLPSALQFLDPPVSDAYHFFQLPESTFQRINAVDQSNPPQTRYLPLTGGIAGSGHVYRLQSSDLLITVHAHRIIHIWDASFMSLRPLTHLTIDCSKDIQDPKAKVTQVELDTQSASLLVAFDNGTVLQYTHHPPPDSQQQISQATQEAFIKNCDNTIDEISELLKDMETGEQESGNSGDVNATETGPQATKEGSAVPEPSPSSAEGGENATPEQQAPTPTTSIPEPCPTGPSIEVLKGDVHHYGYVPAMRIKVGVSIKHLVAASGDMLAMATADGKVFVINTLFGRTVYSTDTQTEMESTKDEASDEGPKDEGGAQTSRSVKQVSSASISCIRFYHTYPSFDTTDAALQLFVGLDNGLTYLHDISCPEKPPILISSNSTSSAVVDIQVFDMQGRLQVVAPNIAEPKESENHALESRPSISSASPEADNDSKESLAVGRKSHESCGSNLVKDEDGASSTKSEKSGGSLGLLRKTTRKFSKSGGRAKEPQPPPPPLPTDESLPATTASDAHQHGDASHPSKRGAPVSKWEYRPQPDPHFTVVTTTKAVYTFLAGYNLRLFTTHLSDINGCSEDDVVVHSQVMTVQQVGACLVLVLQSGTVVFYSLPHLLPVARISLPAELAARHFLVNMSLSTDGRIVAWTGLCELEQYLLLLQNPLSCGEDVVLFDPSRRIPPHPASAAATTQKPKKSWLESVQGAFQKGPLTVAELDALMGKRPIDPKQGASNRTAGTTADKTTQNQTGAESSSGSGSGGVGGVFKELGMKMNERGEKLDQLQTKFEDMNAASGDFLKAVREYNERQAQKKWWEF